MFVSEYFSLTTELNQLGVFDAVLDRDGHFFINVIYLKNSTTLEFVSAYEHLDNFFSEIATILNETEIEGDLFYRRLNRLLHDGNTLIFVCNNRIIKYSLEDWCLLKIRL